MGCPWEREKSAVEKDVPLPQQTNDSKLGSTNLRLPLGCARV